jgi:ABC-type transport system involved in cytochrome bd biosynthesis fused ATPase/permease subunit
MDDVLAAAADKAVLLVTHRPEGLERVDEIVSLPSPAPRG